MEQDLVELIKLYVIPLILANALLFIHSKIPKEKRSYYDLTEGLDHCILLLSLTPLFNIAIVVLITASLLFTLFKLIKRS